MAAKQDDPLSDSFAQSFLDGFDQEKDSIRTDVEPDHIIASHSKAEEYIKRGGANEVVDIFRDATEFWCDFWVKAFEKLGCSALEARSNRVRKKDK